MQETIVLAGKQFKLFRSFDSKATATRVAKEIREAKGVEVRVRPIYGLYTHGPWKDSRRK